MEMKVKEENKTWQHHISGYGKKTPLGKFDIKIKNETIKVLYSKKLLDKLGWDKRDWFIVPIRMEGLTGSGQLGKCHQNVRSLVLRFGGRCVFGYALAIDHFISPEGKVCSIEKWYHHTVWETPEGKIVDVTWNQSSFVQNGIDRFLFIALDYYTPNSKKYIRAFGNIIVRQDKRVYESNNDQKMNNIKLNGHNKVDFSIAIGEREDLFLNYGMGVKKFLKLNIQTYFKVGPELWYDYSKFSQSSIGTGKKLTEFLPKDEYKEIFYDSQSIVSEKLKKENKTEFCY